MRVFVDVLMQVSAFVGRLFLRGMQLFFQAFWSLLEEVFRGFSRGAGRASERIAPIVIGAGVVWVLVVFVPEAIGFVLVFVIMFYALKVMIKGFSPPFKKKR